MRRPKPIALAAGVLLSALVLLSWTLTWFEVELVRTDAAEEVIQVPGETVAPALAALGLAGLALVAALAIAGPAFRLVLGILQAALGASVVLSTLGAIADPVAASAPLITETTGIAGGESIESLVQAVTTTASPMLALAAGALLVACGLFTTVTARKWPSTASRYQAVRLDEADAPRSTVSDWDSLSDGSDPTSR